jgi:cell division septation protein DedD
MRRGMMQALALTICVCLTLFLSLPGCARDEEPLPPVQGTKVVKPIKRPPPPPLPEEGEKPSTTSEGLKQAKTAEKKTEGIKTTAVPAKASEKPDTGAETKETPPKEEPGYYMVKKGDTLARIAGRTDVYGDPLKWPIRPLLGGMRLKIITPDEKKENLEKRANKVWIVNVLSTPNKKEIIPATMKLLHEGYLAYITRTNIKGKDYMRLRVGFFGKKTEADAAGEKIKALLNFGDPWKTKAGKEEFRLIYKVWKAKKSLWV